MSLRIRNKKTPTTYIQFREKGVKKTRTMTVEGTRDQAFNQVRNFLEANFSKPQQQPVPA